MAGMDSMERLYTPQELAAMAGVSAATIKREVHRGRLRGVRVGDGRLIRVPESAWREYLQRAQGEGGRPPTRGKRV